MNFGGLKRWLHWKEHPHSRLRTHNLLKDTIIFVVLVIISKIIYSNVFELNELDLWIFKLGGILLIIFAIASLYFLYKIVKNLRYGFRGSKNYVKIGLLICVLIIAIIAYQNQNKVIDFTKKEYKKFEFGKFNPFVFRADLTSTETPSFKENTETTTENSSNEFPSTIEDVISSIDETVNPKPDIANIEQIIFNKINSLRSNSLEWNDKLAEVARKHSEDMATRNYFSHISPEGEEPAQRAQNAGLGYYGIGENITKGAYGKIICGSGGEMYVGNDEEVAECAVIGWKNSPGHYANIIDPSFKETGVGVAYNGSEFYITQMFKW